MHTHTYKTKKWKKFCALEGVRALEELVRLKGMPEETYALEAGVPAYKPRVFQVVVRPDGIWLHAKIVDQWSRREMYRFIADCDVPSDFRRANQRR